MTVLGRYNQSWHRLGEGVRPDPTLPPKPPTTGGDPNELVTLREAADLLGLSAWQLRRLVNRGQLRARSIGHRWYLTRGEVERFARRMEANS